MIITKYIAVASMLTFCMLPTVGRASSPPGNLVPWQQLHASGMHAGRGSAVAMTSKWLLVGDPDTTNTLSHDGTAVLFRWGDHGWQVEHTYTLADFGLPSNVNARFGAAVAVSGDRVLIGCPGCDGSLHAVLVDVSDTTGTPTWYSVTPPDIAYTFASDEFNPNVSDPTLGTGSVVALLDDLVVVGAPLAYGYFYGIEIGAVCIGHFNGGGVIWDLFLAGEINGEHLGQSLALARTSQLAGSDSYYLLVGAPLYVNEGSFGLAGAAFLYKRSGPYFDLIQTFSNPNPGFTDALGSAVAFSRSTFITTGTVVLGAPGRVAHGVAGGSVRTYKASSGSDNFVFTQEDSLTDPVIADHFGGALALGSSRLLIGADGHQYNAHYGDGAAYLRDGSSGMWSPGQSLLPIGPTDQGFGSAVAVTSRAAAVGAPTWGKRGEGAVYFYLCDGIFSHNFDSSKAFVCAGP